MVDNTDDAHLDPEIGELLEDLCEPYRKVLSQLEPDDGPKLQTSDIAGLVLYLEGHFKRKSDAADAKKALEKSINKLRQLRFEFRGIPPSVVARMERLSGVIIPETADDDQEPEVLARREEHRSFDKLLEAVASELADELKRVEAELDARWSRRGRGADLEARYLAEQVAKLYVRIRGGEKPTVWTKPPYTSEPKTLFEQTVHDLLHLKGSPTGFRLPCEHAVARMTNGEL